MFVFFCVQHNKKGDLVRRLLTSLFGTSVLILVKVDRH